MGGGGGHEREMEEEMMEYMVQVKDTTGLRNTRYTVKKRLGTGMSLTFFYVVGTGGLEI
jgi:hypothetical protein